MIDIRLVTPDSADLLHNVAAEVFDLPVDPQRLARYAAAPGHMMLLALDGAGRRAMHGRHPLSPRQAHRTLYR